MSEHSISQSGDVDGLAETLSDVTTLSKGERWNPTTIELEKFGQTGEATVDIETKGGGTDTVVATLTFHENEIEYEVCQIVRKEFREAGLGTAMMKRTGENECEYWASID